MPFEKINEIIDTIRDAYKMLKEYVDSTYNVRPIKTIIVLLITIVYVVSPIDFIPDLIPILGVTDDAMVLVIAYKLIKDDVLSYRIWKVQNNYTKGIYETVS